MHRYYRLSNSGNLRYTCQANRFGKSYVNFICQFRTSAAFGPDDSTGAASRQRRQFTSSVLVGQSETRSCPDQRENPPMLVGPMPLPVGPMPQGQSGGDPTSPFCLPTIMNRQPPQERLSNTARKRAAGSLASGSLAVVILLAIYAVAQPALNQRFGWNLPALGELSCGRACCARVPRVPRDQRGLQPEQLLHRAS